MTDILNSKYAYGDKLPTLNELCDYFGAGRNSVRLAMVLLEERKFIKNRRGSRAIVIFNVNDIDSQLMYKTAIYERKQALEEIYQLLTWFLPELVCELKKRIDKNELEQLVEKVNHLYADANKIYTQKEFTDTLYQILEEAFALFHNSLLDALFLAVLHFIYLPIPQTNHTQKFTYITRVISESLPKAASFLLSRNDFMLKHLIVLLMQAITRTSMGYVNRIGKEIGPVKFSKFQWKSRRDLDLCYMNTIIEIIFDINNKKYSRELPSLHQLSENYHTSLKTIRKACDLLNEYKIIQKSNGLKSRIIINDIHDPDILLTNEQVVNNIILYKEAIQIVIIMAKGLNKPILSKCSKNQINAFMDTLNCDSKTTLTKYLDFLFQNSNQAVLSIYQELNKSLAWNIYSNILFDPKSLSYDFTKRASEFAEAIHTRNYDEINQYLDEIGNIIENHINHMIA